MHTHKRRYTEFCTVFNLTAFPVTEWQLWRFGTYLSFLFKSPKSIQNYLTTICSINELSGFDKVQKTLLYKKMLDGIRRKLKHVESKAKPFSFELLQKILPFVVLESNRELVIWVVLVFGFHLFLRKSNLRPLSHNFDHNKVFQRRDFRTAEDVMLAHIKWSKTRQHGNTLLLPMVRNKGSIVCTVFWFNYMSTRIPARPVDAAFSYLLKGKMVPITYGKTQKQMRIWLEKVGEPAQKYSMHSLRRVAASTAFRAGLPALAIKTLGDWASAAYLRYIDLTLDTHMKAWSLFSLKAL